MSKRNGTRMARGMSLLESVILVTIMGIVSLGFGIALQSSAHIPDGVDKQLYVHTYLVDKIEDLTSLSFPTLLANSGLSDTVIINGQTLARTVTVTQMDADGVNGVESDFIEVTVTISGQSLKTRVTQP